MLIGSYFGLFYFMIYVTVKFELVRTVCFVSLGKKICINLAFWVSGWNRSSLLGGQLVWCIPLCLSSPTLFEMAGSKGARVADLWKATGPEGEWNFWFERSFKNWEFEEVRRLICMVSTRRINPQSRDGICWKRTKNGTFSKKANFEHCWKEEGNSYYL